MKKLFSFILSLLITISMMPIGNVYASIYKPEEHTLPAGKTLDVSNIRLGEFTPIIYNLDQEGATYTITGSTPSSTCLRIVIKVNCTVILDNTDINAGISYDDNTENDYTGGVNAHGVFEIAGGKSVNFQMQGSNRIVPRNYNAYHDYLLGMLLNVKAKVSFSGSGSLRISGRIGQKIYTPVPWSGMTSYVEMNSGNVSVNGFGNTARSKSGDYYLPAEAITFIYNGGNFENIKDSESSSMSSTVNAASGMIYRVEIPLAGNGYIKTGQDGKFGYWESNGKLYAYQSDTSKKDYYILNNGKYYHYQSGTYGSNKTATAQEVNDENTIGGIKGTISIQGKPMENIQMSFTKKNSDGISYSASCTTDENGNYYASLIPGTYSLKMQIVSENEIIYKDLLSISSESPITKDIDIKALHGQVTDNTGKGIGGATITVNQGNTSFSTKADNNGNYFIIPQGISDGNVFVKAQKIGYESVSGTFSWNSINGLEWNPKLAQKTSNIIEIYNETDLVALADGENQLDGKTIELMNDIVLSGQFKGVQLSSSKTITFNGNNHTISNVIAPLFIDPLLKGNSAYYLQGEVSNLNLNGNIQINSESYSGAIASSIKNCTIDHCSFTGGMKYYCNISTPRVGGLIGNANENNIIKNCNVNIISMDWSGVIFAGGGLVGSMSATKIYNCYVRIDKLNNNIDKQTIDNLGGFVGKIFDYKPNSKTISNCYISVNNCASSSNTIAPIVGKYEKSYNSFIKNYYCGDEGAFRSDDSSQATAISLDVLMAKSGTTIGDQKALVDCLNDYVKDNSTGVYRTWTLGDDSYPTFTSVKSVNAEDVTVTYDGEKHSIDLVGVPEGATVTYSVDDNNYSSTKPMITNAGSKKIYYNVEFENETKTGSATVTVIPATIGIQWGSTIFEYDGTSHVPSATPTNIIGSDSISLTVTGNATDAGKYKATVTNITGKDASNYQLPSNKTKDFTINKANQSAPKNISSTTETIKGKGDGCILGVTNDMEYRKEGTNTYTPVTSDKIEKLSPGKYYIRMKETNNYYASSDLEVTVESGTKQLVVNVPKPQVGYELSVSDKNVDWHGSSTISFTLKEGYSKTDSFVVKVNDQEVTLDEDEKYTLSNIESNVEISVEGVEDTVAPTGTIKVNDNEWKKFINNISFGLFFKNTKDVIITSNDIGSGVEKTYYFISNNDLSENEVRNITDWTEYTSPFSVNPNNHYVIYVKITDKSGNTSYISSDGLVIYSDSEVVTQRIEYIKTTNEDKIIEVNLNGNTVNEVKNGDTVLTKNTDYSLDDSTITLKGTYLQSLPAGKYQIQISYNPLGEAYKENIIDNSNQNDEPNISTVELTVNKAKGSITNISNLNKVYDGNSVNEPTFDSLSTGKKTVEYKLKGSDDATYSTNAPKDVGNYVVRVSVDKDDNYSSTVSTKVFSIDKAKVTVKVNDLTKVYGDKDQELSYEVEGVVDGTPLKDITLSRKKGENVGTYVIKATQKEESNPNYAITFVDGTYTIKPKEIKVKATDNEKVDGKEIIKTNVENTKKPIKTGDDSFLSMWSILFFLSAIVLIAYLEKKEKI